LLAVQSTHSPVPTLQVSAAEHALLTRALHSSQVPSL
jgi:hypothetical protein